MKNLSNRCNNFYKLLHDWGLAGLQFFDYTGDNVVHFASFYVEFFRRKRGREQAGGRRKFIGSL